MKFKSSFTGDVDLVRTYDRLSKAVSRKVAVEALKDGGEPMRATAAVLAPRSERGKDHLADHIIIAETRFGGGLLDGGDVASVAIGPSHKPHDKFYGFFQEHGTAHHAAQPFMRLAFDREKLAVMKGVARAIWTAIRRAVGGA